MKILITGNMGYVGPLVVSALRKSFNNCYIYGIDSGFFAHCLLDKDAAMSEVVVNQQHFLDIRDILPSNLKGIDHVIHLASISNDPMGKLYEDQTWDINSLASSRLAEMAKNAGVKSFTFASSCSIYGQGDDHPRTENDRVNPLTTYAKSKFFLEEALKPLAYKNFKVTCLRFATACGWSSRCRFDLVVNDFVASAMASKKITILSDGSPWRPMIHVQDMAKALVWGIERESGGNYLVVNAGANQNNFQVKDLAKIVASVIPNTVIEIAKNGGPDKRSYRVSFDALEKLTNSAFIEWSVKAAAEDLFEKLKGIQFKDQDLQSSRYIRFNVLKKMQSTGLLDLDLRWNL